MLVTDQSRFLYAIHRDIKPARGELEDFYIEGPSVAFGAFGEVKSVIHKKTRQIRAVKKVPKKNKFDESLEDIFNEIRILNTLDHENILKFHEYYEDSKHFYIVTDFCKGGALYDEIHTRGHF